MKFSFQLLLTGLILLLSSCSSKNLMRYYYPINQKPAVKVYKYVNPENSALSEYWKTASDPVKGTILTESFDSNFNLYNTFEEKINENQAELLRYVEYEKEDGQATKEIAGKINKNNVYSSNKSQSYNYEVAYTNQYGRITFGKKRAFVNFIEIEVQGKKYKTAKFKDEYIISAIDKQDKYEFTQVTFYAEGIGMVKYERLLPTGEIRILELERILSEDEFKEMKKGAMQH